MVLNLLHEVLKYFFKEYLTCTTPTNQNPHYLGSYWSELINFSQAWKTKISGSPILDKAWTSICHRSHFSPACIHRTWYHVSHLNIGETNIINLTEKKTDGAGGKLNYILHHQRYYNKHPAKFNNVPKFHGYRMCFISLMPT